MEISIETLNGEDVRELERKHRGITFLPGSFLLFLFYPVTHLQSGSSAKCVSNKIIFFFSQTKSFLPVTLYDYRGCLNLLYLSLSVHMLQLSSHMSGPKQPLPWCLSGRETLVSLYTSLSWTEGISGTWDFQCSESDRAGKCKMAGCTNR